MSFYRHPLYTDYPVLLSLYSHHIFLILFLYSYSGMAMAIADASHVIDEVWFVAEGSVVKILNFAGTVKGNNFTIHLIVILLQCNEWVHLCC